MFIELLFEPGKFATDWKKSMKRVSLDIKIESMIWYEVIWRNWRKGSGKEDGRKKTKKVLLKLSIRELINLLLENLLEIEKISLEIVSLEKNLANEDSDFGSMFLELLFEPGKFATDWKKSMKIVSLDIKIESMIWY